MKDKIKTIGIYVGIVGALLLEVRGCNMVLNNRTIDRPKYHTESRARGLTGHIEYTRYSDGSQDVKIYRGLGHLFASELHQDLNGDRSIERIRISGPEWKLHRLDDILVLEQDYPKNKKRFDEAEEQLTELIYEFR